jgi:putative proteasome-type protease
VTYCVGICVEEGVVMLSDTRTNAGLDNISTFSKMQVVEVPSERVLVVMTAGNLALTQAVWNRLEMDQETADGVRRLSDVADMFSAAQLAGAAVRAVQEMDGPALAKQGIGFDCSIPLGGRIAGGASRLYLIYAAGYFIEATADTPFLQIGEHKYGKLILDRVLTAGTSLQESVALTLISMDSTIRSNLSVGLPLGPRRGAQRRAAAQRAPAHHRG